MVLGWGSLLWDPRDLATDGRWSPTGPVLPIEFTRVALDGRLTLVLDLVHGSMVCTHAVLSALSLSEAIRNLAGREKTGEEWIGFVDLTTAGSSRTHHPSQIDVHDQIGRWCATQEATAAVWTALPSTFEARVGTLFSVEAGLDYLWRLGGDQRRRAFEYVTRAPKETRTCLREEFEQRLQCFPPDSDFVGPLT